jgi:uncharacterized phage-associated protein
MPYSASLIAYAFVKKGIDERKFVTQMKLQKMVYFAHGFHLATFGKPLVNELFEAWKFGPVIQTIYKEYQSYGNSPITELGSKRDKELQTLDEHAKRAIEFTWAVTKDLSASALSNWTHKENSPWAKAYTPDTWSIAIGNESIKDYFTELLITNGNHGNHHQIA